jgi:hypothetical protein
MNLFEFIGLGVNEQADYVWRGQFITSRRDGDQHVLLYRLNDFYAEVFYDTRKNAITRIKGFNSKSHLLPYINTVGVGMI